MDECNDQEEREESPPMIGLEESKDDEDAFHAIALDMPIEARSAARYKVVKEAFLMWLDKYWFILGLGVAILLAYLFPQIGKKGGFIHSEITTKYLAVCLTFLLSGMSLKLKQIMKVCMQWKLHLTVETISFVMIPSFMWIVVQFLDAVHILMKSNPMADGLIILGCLPTTVSACVILTKSANGNDAAALFNATIGNLIGMVLTPLLLLVYLGRSSSSTTPIQEVLFSLSLTVLLPLTVGQVISLIFPQVVAKLKAKVNFTKVNNVTLLLIVFATFCDTFSKPAMIGRSDLVLIFFVTLSCHLICLASTFALSGLKISTWWGFDRKDRVAILFTATQKTLTVGIPFIGIMFAGDPTVGIKSLPLLIQHPTQILVASLLVNAAKSWISKGETASSTESELNLIPLQ